MHQTLFLMMGYPGSGKTTAGRLISELSGAVHIWADQERSKRFQNPAHTLQENRILYRALDAEVLRLLREGHSVIYDTNFNQARDRRRWRKKGRELGVQVLTAWINTPKDLAYQRTQKEDEHRVFAMLHKVFERMAGNLQPPAEDEQYLSLDGISISIEAIRAALQKLTG